MLRLWPEGGRAMRTVHKYKIPDAVTHVPMPAGAKILCVNIQRGIAVIWAEVDTEAAEVVRKFRFVGTGWEVPDGIYVGTAFHEHLVWHIYEI